MKRKLLFIVVILVSIVMVTYLVVGRKSQPLPKDLQEQLIHSASFEALSLNPEPILNSDKLSTNSDTLLRYPILGHVRIDDQNLRQELVNAVSKDIANANHLPTQCVLEPRHGIRCIDGSNSMLVAICYHCGDVVLSRNGKDEGYLIKMDKSLPDSKKLFQKIFQTAGFKSDVK